MGVLRGALKGRYKLGNARWIKTKGIYYKDFEWQRGYSGYSVSQFKVEIKKKYILNQKDHHKKQSFEDEYRRFLQKHAIDYDEKYLWT
jgi:hypothetical protein